MFTNRISPFFWGIMICLIGAVCFSTKAIFVKLAYRDTNVDAITLLALRMIFSLPFFLISASVYSAKLGNVKFTTKQWGLIALMGCLGYYISSLLDFVGLQFVTASIERLILFIYPTLVLLMNAIIFKQKIKTVQWLAVTVTYAGLILAFISEVDVTMSEGKNFLWGSLLIFICAFTYGVYIVGSGKLIPLVGAVKYNSYAMSFACAGVLIHFLLSDRPSLTSLPTQVYIYSLLMAVISTVVPSYLVALGIKRIGSGNAAIVSGVGPVSTILLAYYFLNETINPSQMVGTAMILFGVILIGSGKKSEIV